MHCASMPDESQALKGSPMFQSQKKEKIEQWKNYMKSRVENIFYCILTTMKRLHPPLNKFPHIHTFPVGEFTLSISIKYEFLIEPVNAAKTHSPMNEYLTLSHHLIINQLIFPGRTSFNECNTRWAQNFAWHAEWVEKEFLWNLIKKSLESFRER